ncbi:LysR substrate-binding domain-containing protein [Pelagibacterium montanilacus]|uniref:LysR substrate-binding domain-containing protein n=1 Tax=Pelagibacterium montanilacus TaxID=2185280 RepID=UPI000F8F1603|nr:LysR substrate-binding domain-containing protein [Pelagibacterium montanilacus]
MDLPRRSIPSVAGLVAFEATARHLSFSRAAEDLCLSQGAVSKRVRQLEQVVGVPLLARTRHQVCLTDMGRAYLAQIRQLLEDLEVTTEALRTRARGRDRIVLAAPLPFASRWLVPRLHRYRDAHPDIALDIVTGPDADGPEPDCQIHLGRPHDQDVVVSPLFDLDWTPVATPSLRDRLGLTAPADLARARLLAQSDMSGLWPAWFARMGAEPGTGAALTFEGFELVAAAALAGHGVAILPRALVARELRSHDLVVLFEGTDLIERGFHLAVPGRLVGDPALTGLARWLVGEAAAPVRHIRAA